MVNPALHSVLLRDDARAKLPPPIDRRYAIDLANPANRDDHELRAAMLTELAAHGSRYQDVIVWGETADAQHLLSLGFAADWQQGGLLIARFVGCPLTVRIDPGNASLAGEQLEVGWYPSWHVSHQYPLERGTLQPDGSRSLLLRQTCGKAWIRYTGKGYACEGADTEGRLLLARSSDQPEALCRLRSAELARR
jgi:hypothetical protein